MTGERTPPGLGGYDRTREEIARKYRELAAERRRLATQQTRFEEACQRVPPEYRPDPSWSDRLWQILERIQEKIDTLLSDLNLPIYAYQDSVMWTDIGSAATQASNKIVKIGSHANDPETWRSGVRQDLVGGRAYPGRGGRQYPWAGITGNNYRSQIPGQQRAADRVSLLAMRTASATNSAATNIVFLYAAVLTLIIAALLAIKLIVAVLVALGNALLWIAGALTGGVMLAVGLRIGLQFLRNAFLALLALVEKIWGAFLAWVATAAAVEWAVRQQTYLLENMVTEDEPNRSAAFPNGKWPNPTTDDAFPHMERGPDGQWRVYTLPEYPR